MTTPNGAEHRDLEQRFRDLERGVADLTTATLRRQPLDPLSVQYDADSQSLGASFVEYVPARRTITVPVGYTRAQIILFVSAGATLNTNASAGVAPIVAGVFGPGQTSTASGANAYFVNSFQSKVLTDLGATFTVGLAAYTSTAGTLAELHLSAAITFLR